MRWRIKKTAPRPARSPLGESGKRKHNRRKYGNIIVKNSYFIHLRYRQAHRSPLRVAFISSFKMLCFSVVYYSVNWLESIGINTVIVCVVGSWRTHGEDASRESRGGRSPRVVASHERRNQRKGHREFFEILFLFLMIYSLGATLSDGIDRGSWGRGRGAEELLCAYHDYYALSLMSIINCIIDLIYIRGGTDWRVAPHYIWHGARFGLLWSYGRCASSCIQIHQVIFYILLFTLF